MLAVERLERSEEPLAGRLRAAGDASEVCSLVWAEASKMEALSLAFSGIELPAVPRSVWRVKPARAGVVEMRWASGEWCTPVSIVGSAA